MAGGPGSPKCRFGDVLSIGVALVAQLCLTLCDPMGCSPTGWSGVLQARILEWVAISHTLAFLKLGVCGANLHDPGEYFSLKMCLYSIDIQGIPCYT